MEKPTEQLHQLVKQACNHPPGSPQRQKYLTKIIRIIARQLWQENTSYYQDALQQTWIYFCQNICEGNTGEPYDSARGTLVTWLNYYLKRRLQDFFIDTSRQQARTVDSDRRILQLGETEPTVDPIENLAAEPDVPPLLEEVRKWAQTDPEGELRHLHIANHPEVTCQVLILRRLPPETSWKTLAVEFNLSISTLSSFYQRQCLPRLRKFGESEGYL